MHIIVDLKDIIAFGLIIGFVIIGLIYAVIKTILDIGKKNCYDCKHYKLDGVAGCGDCCWYRCMKHNRKDEGTSMNTRAHLERCKDFEKELEEEGK